MEGDDYGEIKSLNLKRNYNEQTPLNGLNSLGQNFIEEFTKIFCFKTIFGRMSVNCGHL